ncbi:hypothetical protein BDA99DRAFT_570556 [Phascolomyces articulosus]|uniref:Uncharacterized protein n=1 Tax=Phascolomyces articulosus TaxID=60185 RepID=A0AAD5PHB6_9FUNG|nr:hypothetical protein BDA99DRAFT_570556 [Phascolomyces articulosus]
MVPDNKYINNKKLPGAINLLYPASSAFVHLILSSLVLFMFCKLWSLFMKFVRFILFYVSGINPITQSRTHLSNATPHLLINNKITSYTLIELLAMYIVYNLLPSYHQLFRMLYSCAKMHVLIPCVIMLIYCIIVG